MFQLKENAEDIVKFISNSKDISKRDIAVLNSIAYGFSTVPETYKFWDVYKTPNPVGISLLTINLFTYMSYVFNMQPTNFIELWIYNRILFLPGTKSSIGINLEKTTNRFVQKHRNHIRYVVQDDLKSNTLKFITDIDEINDILYRYNESNDYAAIYADNKKYIVKKKESSVKPIDHLNLTNIEIIHNTKKIIKELSGVTNKEYKELTNEFINKSDCSVYPIPIDAFLFDSYAPIIKIFSSKYHIKVDESLIIYCILEELSIPEYTFMIHLKSAFKKLYNKKVEKENLFILSESVKNKRRFDIR